MQLFLIKYDKLLFPMNSCIVERKKLNSIMQIDTILDRKWKRVRVRRLPSITESLSKYNKLLP